MPPANRPLQSEGTPQTTRPPTRPCGSTGAPWPRALSVEEVKAPRAQIRGDKAAIWADLYDVMGFVLAPGAVLARRWQSAGRMWTSQAGRRRGHWQDHRVIGKIIRYPRQGITREDTTKGKGLPQAAPQVGGPEDSPQDRRNNRQRVLRHRNRSGPTGPLIAGGHRQALRPDATPWGL
jgi:hypothetical protein